MREKAGLILAIVSSLIFGAYVAIAAAWLIYLGGDNFFLWLFLLWSVPLLVISLLGLRAACRRRWGYVGVATFATLAFWGTPVLASAGLSRSWGIFHPLLIPFHLGAVLLLFTPAVAGLKDRDWTNPGLLGDGPT
ncbi:MAG: hypothetical protein Kow00129_13020 [Thermoleophilia bacterium]